MTTRAASQSTTALGPVGPSAFVYEASDIPPGTTIDQFRSQRPGNRHRRGLRALLTRLGVPARSAAVVPEAECREVDAVDGVLELAAHAR